MGGMNISGMRLVSNLNGVKLGLGIALPHSMARAIIAPDISPIKFPMSTSENLRRLDSLPVYRMPIIDKTIIIQSGILEPLGKESVIDVAKCDNQNPLRNAVQHGTPISRLLSGNIVDSELLNEIRNKPPIPTEDYYEYKPQTSSVRERRWPTSVPLFVKPGVTAKDYSPAYTALDQNLFMVPRQENTQPVNIKKDENQRTIRDIRDPLDAAAREVILNIDSEFAPAPASVSQRRRWPFQSVMNVLWPVYNRVVEKLLNLSHSVRFYLDQHNQDKKD